MFNNAVTVGTPTTTGGKVLTGTAGVKINNLDVSLLGDQATCTCGDENCRGVGPIIQGRPRNIKIGGKLIAMKDDPVDTGCGNCFVLSSGDAVSLGPQMSGSINMGAGVNIGQGVNINMGSGVSLGQGVSFSGRSADAASSQSLASATQPSIAGKPITSAPHSQTTAGFEESNELNDIDDVYIIFSGEKIDIKTFAKDVYQTDSNEIVQHIIKLNPHLKRTFHFLTKGMPIVVSPWKTVHPDEAKAITQVSELAELFFTLSEEQQEWFSDHHEEFASVMLTSTAMPNSTVYEVDDGEVKESNFTNQMIASVGSGIVGMKIQAERLQKEFQRFDNYSKYVGESTKGVAGDKLKSNPDYKLWRKQARTFQREVQTISTQFGAPNYIKNIQAKKVNYYLNVGKKQIYKAQDFSKAVSGIDMTALYKKSMEFSKLLGRAAWVATILGVRDNFMDIAKVCAKDEGFSEACMRAGVKNTASIAMNVGVGEGIGFVGVKLVPVSRGLSIIPMAGGLYIWGLYGVDLSNYIGDKAEYAVFDLYDDTVEFMSSTVDYIESLL
ncbi:hypothetical protein DA100_07175 [Vibrio sp. Hep-1b-8]|nr:hypothetical protein DA100_07175 [Vibrio sp. Hep-1b-8]